MEAGILKTIIPQVINESHYPVLFKNMLKNEKGENLWELLNWNLDELSEKFGDVELPFREGINNVTVQPQWEYKCPIKYFTMKNFLEISKVEKNSKWYYFDYKYMHEWFENNSEIINSINWQLLGCNVKNETSTVWIGNKGAHTNCHKDTYGNNLVAQIYGRKQWILYPKDVQNFCETRDPYEESTIYTKLNFFTPSVNEINHLKLLKYMPRIVTLEPGDLLFVPHGWWHFVESLDISISVNVWFPLKTDCFNRLSEALVKLVVNKIGIDIPIASKHDKSDLYQCLNFVQQSLTECKLAEKSVKILTQKESTIADDNILKNIFINYSNSVKIIEEMSMKEFATFLENRSLRFKNNDIDSIDTEINEISVNHQLESEVVNALCNSNIMQQVVEMLCVNNFNKNV